MPDRITQILKAIADPMRREIFHALVVAATALPITQVSSQFAISRQGVTKHIKTLEEAGLVQISKKGRERYCKADVAPLMEITKWLKFYEQFWDNAISDLDTYLSRKS